MVVSGTISLQVYFLPAIIWSSISRFPILVSYGDVVFSFPLICMISVSTDAAGFCPEACTSIRS